MTMVVHPCLHVDQVSTRLLNFIFNRTLDTRSTRLNFSPQMQNHNFTKAPVTLVNLVLRLWHCGCSISGAIIIVSLQALYCFIGFFTHSGHVFICLRHVIYGAQVLGDPAHLTLKSFYCPPGKRCRNCWFGLLWCRDSDSYLVICIIWYPSEQPPFVVFGCGALNRQHFLYQLRFVCLSPWQGRSWSAFAECLSKWLKFII